MSVRDEISTQAPFAAGLVPSYGCDRRGLTAAAAPRISCLDAWAASANRASHRLHSGVHRMPIVSACLATGRTGRYSRIRRSSNPSIVLIGNSPPDSMSTNR